jgi:sortase A
VDISEILPTLEAVNAAELPAAGENARVPTEFPDGLEQYKEDYQEQIAVEEDLGAQPLWIYVAEIALEAPIIPATSVTVEMEEDGKTYEFIQWEAPDEFAVGWHSSSARLGKLGNTVLNGHHNVYGRVFRNLVYLQEGDFIQVYGSDDKWYTYVIANKMVLPEWNVPLETRIENAAWTLPSQDERLTLITCWPEQSASHRLIIVARPVHW